MRPTKTEEIFELTDAELEHVSGGKITTVHKAPGSGQVVPGGGQGLDTENVNPSGKAPPGQN
jgi:hypothetical protein